MRKIKVSEATGAALDWLVAKCLGVSCTERLKVFLVKWGRGEHRYSTDWSQGGPIIEREKIDTEHDPNGKDVVMGRMLHGGRWLRRYGPTPLIAAMRCYVASKLGDEVAVPEELPT